MSINILSPAIEKRRLGRTGHAVTQIGLGGAWLTAASRGGSVERGATIVRHALASGINYVDTAECYSDSELAIGLALENHAGEVFLATKFGHVPKEFDFSREAVLESVRRSQERLRYRPIDLLQLHTPKEPAWDHVQSAIAGMQEARERGWCRYLGITGRDLDFLRRCLATDVFDTMLVFRRYDLLDQSATGLIAEAHSQDIGVVLGSPLRTGVFAGGTKRAELSPKEESHLQALEQLFASEPGGLLAAAMRFAWGNPYAATVLSGVGSLAELEILQTMERNPLSPEQIETIHQLYAERIRQ